MKYTSKKADISFIEAPLDWQDRITKKTKNYAIEILASILIQKKIISKTKINYYDFTFNSEKIENIKINDSKIYAFSMMQPNFLNTIKLSKLIKNNNPNSKIILGGIGTLSHNKSILKKYHFIDFIITNNSPLSFAKLIKFLINNKTKLENIPNLIFRNNNNIIKTKNQYDKIWQKIYPENIICTNTNLHQKNHYLVLGSIGCKYNCKFCSLTKYTQYQERKEKYITKEIENRIKQQKNNNKLSFQILDQNYSDKIESLTIKLNKKHLTKKINAISFNSRADTFLENISKIKKTIKHNPNIFFTIFIGIENYDNQEIKRLGKTITAKTNIQATITLNDLEKENNNFSYKTSFIGINEETTKNNLLNNLKLVEEIYIKKNIIKPVFFLFTTNLRNDNLIKNFLIEPKDEETCILISSYKNIINQLPAYSKRINYTLKNFDSLDNQEIHEFIWAEILIIKAILTNKEKTAKEILKKLLKKFNLP